MRNMKEQADPLISIVVPSFNQGTFLEQNLKSITDQGYKKYEIILLDGGSIDISRLIINKYRSLCSFIRQEKDSGHYAAINEGFSIAKGDLFMWLNSDDMLHPGALGIAARAYKAFKGKAALFTGLPCTWDELGQLTSINLNPPAWGKDYFLEMNLQTDSFMQQESTFFTRSLWEEVGGLQCNKYPYAADFDLWLRMCKHSPIIRLPSLIGGFRIHAQQRSHQVERYHFEVQTSRAEFRTNQIVFKAEGSTSPPASRPTENTSRAGKEIRHHSLRSTAGTLYTSVSPRNTCRQQDSIANWLGNGFRVVSVNSSEEAAAIQKHYPSIEFVEPTYTLQSRYGKPYVPITELLSYCANTAGYSAIINSDIRFLSTVSAESVIANSLNNDEADNTLFLGCRVELADICSQLDGHSAVKGLPPLRSGRVYTYGFDLIVANQEVWQKVSEAFDDRHSLGLGIPWWDYYLPYIALEAEIQLKLIYPPIIAHPYHSAQYSAQVWNDVGQGIAKEILDIKDEGSSFVKLDEFSRDMIKFIHGSADEVDFGQSLRGPSPALSLLRKQLHKSTDRLHWMAQTPDTYHRSHYGIDPI